jgi:hypothetical protein
MHVVDETPDVMAEATSPDWVADWWIPPVGTPAVDHDLEALLVPEPAPVIAVGVRGRTVPEREATAV